MEYEHQIPPSWDKNTPGQPQKEIEPSLRVWSAGQFEQHLVSSQEFPYENLPQEIQLDEKWHRIITQLTLKTAQDGHEWGVSLAGFNRWKDPRRVSLPFDWREYFQACWGDDTNPIFVTDSVRGTPEGMPSQGRIPAVIEWDGENMVMRRIGFIHTHPDHSPFSEGDLSANLGEDSEKIQIAAGLSHNYLLIRTRVVPYSESIAALEHMEAVTDRYVLEHVEEPSWKQRYLGIRDEKYEQRVNQAYEAMSYEFCRTYEFGLYRGKPEHPLKRLA